ncbi:hypothetical protein VP01_3969g1, partial [Puccinia sorghi]
QKPIITRRKVTDQRYSSGVLSKTLFRRWIERATLKSLKGLAMTIPEERNHPLVKREKNFKDGQKKKNYTIETIHQGNSNINCRIGGKDIFGSVQRIFSSAQLPEATFLEVTIFVALEKNATGPDPPTPPQTMVILSTNVVGHIAVLTNPPEVFGTQTPTILVAVVHHLVSTQIPAHHYAVHILPEMP